jgi:hypothetical protein
MHDKLQGSLFRYIPNISLKGQKKAKKKSVRVADLPLDIWTGDFYYEPKFLLLYRAIQKEVKRNLQDTERLLLWSRHFATRSPLAAVARKTFPRQLQTNFESFPNNCCISRDCRLTGYFIINVWKC